VAAPLRAAAASRPAPALALSLESADIVDYGAAEEPLSDESAAPGAYRGPDVDEPLQRELQRSLDVWERTWPDKPLAGLWLALGDDTEALLPRLRQRLSLPVHALDPFAAWPAAQADAARAAFDTALREGDQGQVLRDAGLPLLGALLAGGQAAPGRPGRTGSTGGSGGHAGVGDRGRSGRIGRLLGLGNGW
jgi:hypothetical protein